MTEHRPEEVEGLESARGPEMPVLPFKSKCCRDCILPITDIIEPRFVCSKMWGNIKCLTMAGHARHHTVGSTACHKHSIELTTGAVTPERDSPDCC